MNKRSIWTNKNRTDNSRFLHPETPTTLKGDYNVKLSKFIQPKRH